MRLKISHTIVGLVVISVLYLISAIPAVADTPDVTITSIDLDSQKAGAENVGCEITLQAIDSINSGDRIIFEFDDDFDFSMVGTCTASPGIHFEWAGIDISSGSFAFSPVNTMIIDIPVGGNVASGSMAVFRILPGTCLGNPNVSQETETSCIDQGGSCLDINCKDMTPHILY